MERWRKVKIYNNKRILSIYTFIYLIIYYEECYGYSNTVNDNIETAEKEIWIIGFYQWL